MTSAISLSDMSEVAVTEAHGCECNFKCFLAFCKRNWFMITTLIGVALGFGIGFALNMAKPSPTVVLWVGMPGTIYIRLLTLTILPMIAANIIVVMATLNPKQNGKISLVALVYLLASNVGASVIGLAYGYIIQPGKNASATGSSTEGQTSSAQLSYIFRDLLVNLFPDNVVAICLFQSQTDTTFADNATEILSTDDQVEGTNMIGILFVSLMFGLATNAVGEQGKPFLNFFRSLAETVMLLMSKFLLITPIGVCFMIIGSIAETEGLAQEFIDLGLFVASVAVGILTLVIIQIIVLVIITRRSPLSLLKYSGPAFFIAFATTSAASGLPKMYEGADLYGASKPISRFVLPFVAALKSDASAVFIVLASMFLAARQNISLNPGVIVIILLLATAYVTALPNIPSSSVVVIITILKSIGVNDRDVALLFAVEWINDRMRSGAVALSHMICVAITDELCSDPSLEEDYNKEVLDNASNISGKDNLEVDASWHGSRATTPV